MVYSEKTCIMIVYGRVGLIYPLFACSPIAQGAYADTYYVDAHDGDDRPPAGIPPPHGGALAA